SVYREFRIQQGSPLLHAHQSEVILLDRIQTALESAAIIADGESKPTSVVLHGCGDPSGTRMLVGVVDSLYPNADELLLSLLSQGSRLPDDADVQLWLRTSRIDVTCHGKCLGELTRPGTRASYLNDTIPRFDNDLHGLRGDRVDLVLLRRRNCRVNRPSLQTIHERLYPL